MELRIDPEFKDLIPALKPGEYDGLKQSLIKEGCRDALVTWEGIILDGHNRYEICQREDLKFKTIEKSFEDREAAMDWIDANQLSRRNLTSEQESLIRGRRHNRLKKTRAEAGAMGGSSKDQNDTCSPSTAESLAKEHGVSAPTIKRDAQFASAVEKLKPYIPNIEQRVMTGDIPSKQAVIKAAKEPEKAVEILTKPARKTKPKKETKPKKKEESDVLFTLKRWWKKARKKEKKIFLEWIKEN